MERRDMLRTTALAAGAVWTSPKLLSARVGQVGGSPPPSTTVPPTTVEELCVCDFIVHTTAGDLNCRAADERDCDCACACAGASNPCACSNPCTDIEIICNPADGGAPVSLSRVMAAR